VRNVTPPQSKQRAPPGAGLRLPFISGRHYAPIVTPTAARGFVVSMASVTLVPELFRDGGEYPPVCHRKDPVLTERYLPSIRSTPTSVFSAVLSSISPLAIDDFPFASASLKAAAQSLRTRPSKSRSISMIRSAATRMRSSAMLGHSKAARLPALWRPQRGCRGARPRWAPPSKTVRKADGACWPPFSLPG
jgi:hypothetical protein